MTHHMRSTLRFPPAAASIVWAPVLRAFGRSRHVRYSREVAAAMLLIGLPCCVPALATSRESSHHMQCANNLKQIALALHNYHAIHDSFPPAYVADETGRPMHSWRVLILPYLEQQALYDKYDFTEPWDGPNNRKLAMAMPAVYRCPQRRGLRPTTSYVAVVGPKTAWPGAEPTSTNDVSDGTCNTILVVEVVPGSGMPWMAPRDLSLEDALHGVDGDREFAIGSRHPRDGGLLWQPQPGAWVAFADGTIHWLPRECPPDVLEALFSIDGGEAYVEPNDVVARRIHWPRLLGRVAVVVIAAALVLVAMAVWLVRATRLRRTD